MIALVAQVPLQKYSAMADDEVKKIRERLAFDIADVEQKRDARIQYLTDNPRLSKNKVIPRTAEIQQETAIADAQIAELRRQSEKNEEFQRVEAERQARAFQSEVETLQNQLTDSSQHPHLRPSLHLSGTDLYTRNYGA